MGRRCSSRADAAFVNPARGYADVGRNTSGAIFRPGSMMSIPKRAFLAFGSRRESDGAPFLNRSGRSIPGSRRRGGSQGKSVRRNSGLDGAQGAPTPPAPVVIVEFGVSGFATVESSARRGDAPLRTAATANADPGTSQMIAV